MLCANAPVSVATAGVVEAAGRAAKQRDGGGGQIYSPASHAQCRCACSGQQPAGVVAAEGEKAGRAGLMLYTSMRLSEDTEQGVTVADTHCMQFAVQCTGENPVVQLPLQEVSAVHCRLCALPACLLLVVLTPLHISPAASCPTGMHPLLAPSQPRQTTHRAATTTTTLLPGDSCRLAYRPGPGHCLAAAAAHHLSLGLHPERR